MFDLAKFKGDLDFLNLKGEIQESLYEEIKKLIRMYEDLKDDFRVMKFDYERILGGDV